MKKDSDHLDTCIPYALWQTHYERALKRVLHISCTFREIGNTSMGFLCSMNTTRVSLLVMNSASAPDWHFSATLLHACVILPKSTHPFHPAHARCGDLTFCRFTDLRTTSVPAFQLAETFMTCLTQSGPFAFKKNFFTVLKG